VDDKSNEIVITFFGFHNLTTQLMHRPFGAPVGQQKVGQDCGAQFGGDQGIGFAAGMIVQRRRPKRLFWPVVP
jgi:hypothetical protein